jgi:DNA-binding CsgD family transcriptional regulator
MNKEILEKLYILENKNPYEIAEILDLNHKTVRSYLRKFDIKLRTASEYNFLAKKNYSLPSEEDLYSGLSIAAHTAYLCEGWHTSKTNYIYFCNQDPNLINIVSKCLKQLYKVSNISITICGNNKDSCLNFLNIYPGSKFSIDLNRKNPIIRIKSGGKMLARDFISNAYKLLNSLEAQPPPSS